MIEPAGDGGLDGPDDHSHQRIGWVEQGALWVASAATVCTLVLITGGVVARNLFSYSIDFVNELSGYLLVCTFFLSLAACEATDSFHRVELLRSRLSAMGRDWLDFAMHLISLAACLVLFFYLARFELQTWNRGDVANTILGTPLALPRLMMPLGTALLCYTMVATSIRLFRRVTRLRLPRAALTRSAHDA
jgi:TRAP-type C4-dicarboxylate transport system permease small subunit